MIIFHFKMNRKKIFSTKFLWRFEMLIEFIAHSIQLFLRDRMIEITIKRTFRAIPPKCAGSKIALLWLNNRLIDEHDVFVRNLYKRMCDTHSHTKY